MVGFSFSTKVIVGMFGTIGTFILNQVLGMISVYGECI
jgi:hypothetical protein